ncbi:MAG: ABC transporter permease [Coriobacteriia bacterium]|nr:ABC transporter permease [Coriobacteriia bacterium]
MGRGTEDCRANSMPLLHAPQASRGGNRRRVLVGIVAAVVFLAAVFVAGRLLWDAALATNFGEKNLAPCAAHLFGTDWMGRDMLARTLAGLSTSVFVGLLSAGCSAIIALALAVVAALGGRAADAAVSWLTDLMMGIPHIVLLILVSYALGRGFWGVTIAVATTHWGSLARVLRAEILQVKDAPHVKLAQAAGATRMQLVVRHILPAVLPQLIVGAVLAFPHAILHEASITFLGFGLSADEPAIGVILSEAMQYLSTGEWWLAVLPGAALVAVVAAFDRIGSLLRSLLGSKSVQE